ncbi:DUF6776 family protein [Aliidiomarina maris]|uniref:Uncharacterized protein n=1 Tax=Aliidiomarina maris TaxID=531312 RepID=A0A327WYX5_9GAMM|nr:DUF6776 family protein [Aliidiomarina maris]RAJ94962.1 hypothetical protein B0I24_11248 [Aliidiomarina maris]RUO22170.1 hypothetical protein CWE07_11335 [Aliidiomarina maris]
MSFTALRQRFGRFKFTLLVLVSAGLCVWVGYEIGNARLQFLEQERERYHNRIERLQGLNEQLEYQNNILRVERDVDRVAIQNLQQELRQAHESSADVRRELAFFQRVMAPELDADGVTIDSLALWPANENSFHFRLILLQLERAQQGLTTGTYQITLRGRYGSEVAEYNLLELADVEHDNGERSFAMNYFSRLDGTFKLPADFAPELIEVQVRVRGGRQTTQQFTWGELTQETVQSIEPE